MANLNDVAREAGVSPITVSRVMNGSPAVRPETRGRVLEAVKKLGYQPNLLARGLTADRINSIGVLMTRFENPMYSRMISGISSEVMTHDYDLLLSGSNDLDSSVNSVLTLINKRVSGMIVLPVEYCSDEKGSPSASKRDIRDMDEFARRFGRLIHDYAPPHFHVVTIGRQISDGVDGKVIENYQAGASMAVEYLARCGHTQIGFLSNYARDVGIWGDRYRGFYEGMAKCGLPVQERYIAYCGESLESSAEAMNSLLKGNSLPTAIYCANDTIAAGAMGAIIRAGLRVPEDISLIGHDGSAFGEMLIPPLTTIAIYPLAIGRKAAALLMEILRGGSGAEVLISPRLVERGSVKRLNEPG